VEKTTADTFCPIPWNFQAVRSNGDIRVCCQANISDEQGVLRKSDGTSFNAKDGSLEVARNSTLMKEIRKDMLNGAWNAACTRCQQEESAGLNSRRKYEREQWSLKMEEAQQLTSDDGTLNTEESPVRYYDLRFGNLCNLKCRMCGPTDSSLWYEDWQELTGLDTFKDTSGVVKLERKGERWVTDAYDWHYSEEFWKDIENNLSNIQHIYMAGGEPLLIKRHYDFLEKCRDRDVAKNITLEYNTNTTQLPEKVLKLWTHFKQVRVGASIDGFGAVAEYQRFPSKWESVYNNLRTLNAQPSNILVWLAFTVTVHNIFHIVDFMKWKLQNDELRNINRTQRRPIITHHMAHNPKHLNVRVLPEALKKKARDDLFAFVEWTREKNYSEAVQFQAQTIADSISKYMFAKDFHTSHWKEFCKYTAKLDRMRGQKILDIVPQFDGYMEAL